MEALVADDTGFPKDGTASPCVARQYAGTLGKTANCLREHAEAGRAIQVSRERWRVRTTDEPSP